MKTQAIKLSEIAVVDRLRPTDDNYVSLIADSMAQDGLLQAIMVRPTHNASNGKTPYTLISGAHRLAAATSLEWADISCTVIECSADEALLIEIDENLMRQELTVLARARSFQARKEVYERLYPETKQGGDRRSLHFKNQNDNLSVLKFTKAAAEKIGLSQKSIERSLYIAKHLDGDAAAALQGTPSANNQAHLMALCKLAPKDQRKVASHASEDADFATAMAKLKGKSKDEKEDDGGLSALVKAFDKATPKARTAFLSTLENKVAA